MINRAEMKIAIPTDDGEHVSGAFGHAHFFYIYDTDSEKYELKHNETLHKNEWVRHFRAIKIAEVLKDAEVVITSHMGKPMLDKMLSNGKVIYIAPKLAKISEALALYFAGKLKKITKE